MHSKTYYIVRGISRAIVWTMLAAMFVAGFIASIWFLWLIW